MERRLFLKALGVGCIGCCCSPLQAFASTKILAYDPAKLLKDYDLGGQGRRELYLSLFGDDTIDQVLGEMRDSYEALIADIPYIGPYNFHLQWAIPNAEKLADYLVAKKYGVTIPQFSRLHLDKAESDLMTQTEEKRLEIGSMQFGPVAELMMRFVAWRSQWRIFPEDYILKFVPGDGVNFDWGLDYTQCPNVILYSRHGAADLVYPLVCSMDYVAGKAFKIGYYRTTDIARGGSKCDLRWKQGVESIMPDLGF